MRQTLTGVAPTAAPSRPSLWDWLRRNRQHFRQFSPPFRSWHFWMIQGLVILIASIHGIMETTDLFQKWNVPFIMPTGFFLVPVVYAALTFGLYAALITALWATVLSIFNIIWWHQGMERLGEISQVLMVIVVAFFVGREVDRVKGARQQAETAAIELKASRMRYRSLFESSPAAILVLDAKGVILEANPAAAVLFNTEKSILEGLTVDALFGTTEMRKILGVPLRDGGPAEPITVKVAGGTELYLEPMTNELGDDLGNPITEVLFRDVTREYGRQTGQRAYTAHITRAQEEERQRIARDIHDQTIQSLLLVCRRLDTIQDVNDLPPPVRDTAREARATAEEIVKGLRDFIKALRPPTLDDLGLVTSIRRLLEDFTERTGIPGKFRFTGEERRLPSNVELGLFRVAQEALWNVEHHAEANRVVVAMTFARFEARLEVIDNGKGFTMPANPGDLMTTGHLGLISMQERAKLLDGKLTIRTSPGNGTLIIVSIPITDDAPET